MSGAAFIELVEARTKLASILPCVVGILFAGAYFGHIDGLNSLLFFVAMLVFDMTTTAINNLMDYHKAIDQPYLQQTNVLGRYHLAPRRVAGLIWGMLALATALGLLLAWRTSWLLVLLGGACFVIGIFYTFGPLPLNRLPLGEVFSGVTMGLGIPLIAVFVNVEPTSFLAVSWQAPQLFISGNWIALLTLGLVAVVPMATVANVMLANNLSDLDEDRRNQRTTLPMYLSHKQGLGLYQALAYAGYPAVTIAVIFKLVHWPLLLVWLSLPLVVRATRVFVAKQDKRATFKTAIQNLVCEHLALILGLALDWGLRR